MEIKDFFFIGLTGDCLFSHKCDLGWRVLGEGCGVKGALSTFLFYVRD